MSTVAKTYQSVNQSFDREDVAYWLDGLFEPSMAARFASCGEPGRGWVGVCPEGHETYCPFWCENRMCPSCSSRRAAQMAKSFVPAVQSVVANAPSNLGLRHIILGTDVSLLEYAKVVNDRRLDRASLDGLREVIKLYRGYVVDMFKALWGHDKEVGFAVGVEFGMKGLMLHFHVLALSPFVGQRELSNLWKQVSLGRGGYVWIEKVGADALDIEKSVRYVTKYVTKPLGKIREDRLEGGDVSANQRRVVAFIDRHGFECVLAALAYTFKGLRRFQEYGKFYGMERPEDEQEVCSVCGADYHWMPEIDWAKAHSEGNNWRALLNSLNTNKLLGDVNPGKDLPFKIRLPGL